MNQNHGVKSYLLGLNSASPLESLNPSLYEIQDFTDLGCQIFS